MDQSTVKDIFQSLREGRIGEDEAMEVVSAEFFILRNKYMESQRELHEARGLLERINNSNDVTIWDDELEDDFNKFMGIGCQCGICKS
ncbi:hypothetical protein [Aneurinibacillus aneurinilyticus]|uniref:Uncharacterized protein n=1 Tax=Aneurinibacillus aneurinilyticus ATCC 12856 TaxID=649747 RepID=U1WFH8_ANEAE|nr:hypothetical protein [Aneurinibacillus aneurinilyticus]ERI07279.1 hypothetical protein HMPREF0083_04654 [Aneurinibacillus aneurinilyticus ATCC 12856]MED0704787.1 hypothetical protein [Aneurinibacillus aneurinilyticus]MED0723347.1 hypothetical protein [Aneurinibacillus aneurinilyticus]MED0730435.1 hypothetical protein [Aneurinibacillus aneurinilyticus]MED0739167.1 hypothetical protein [Aneurinibacillus aneurinilyticus]